jgi:hypothetical protein
MGVETPKRKQKKRGNAMDLPGAEHAARVA